MLADGVTTLPDQMVYKLSYQTEGHTFEGHLFSMFLGQFGIIDVVGFHICDPEEPFGSTEYLVRNGSFWNFTQGASGTPEKRYLHCTAMSLECIPLLDNSDKEAGIPTPAELLGTILHAMIGKPGFIPHLSNLMLFPIQVTIICFLVACCTETSVTAISSGSGSRSNAPGVAPWMCKSYILTLCYVLTRL